MRRVCAWLVAIAAWLPCCAPAVAVDYEHDIKPILRAHCMNCHGPLRQKAGLRLDHVTFMRQGGDSGPAIAAASDDSLLLRAVSGTADFERMPLEAKPLADDDVARLRAWIDAGAPAPDEPLPTDPRQHWAFNKPVRPPLPEVQNRDWAAHPIDRFLAAEHERRGLAPSPPAAKNVLLRRLYIDLVGYPPTVDQLRAFMADPSDAAYERIVDELLASPQYGQRWGRHWMDVWRYSDWDGYGAEVRESQPHIWRWRDWIIESLNADKPYDEMIREMLAADELMPDDPQALRATGFLARNWYRFNRNVWLEATVEHTSKAFLGITLNCARCHDHMYDPILQTEYYQFRAFFEPHNVRTDRVPAQSDTKLDGVARVFDAKADSPTFLFVRGNEAKPDKDHPLAPAVPRVLGGDALAIAPVALPPMVSYPGLRPFVQQEALSAAQAEVDRSQSAMAEVATKLVEARKKLADTTLTELQRAAAVVEQDMLAAAAELVTVRAKITADNAAFANPPRPDAAALAVEANRAQRVATVEQAKRDLARLERDLDNAKAETDEAGKKKVAEIEKTLEPARKAHETAQATLGQSSDTYTRFSEVYPTTSSGRRAALARWIASNNNPLTARVAVNQIWMRHFGAPLVPSVFDFGINGKPPTHPAVLDWLAVELVDNGWRTKALHRLIVTSSAYRMSSTTPNEANRSRDSENNYLWRMHARRMEAEVVRDSTLRITGGLDLAMGGADLDPKLGLTVPRRSVYFRSSKEKKVTFLEMFDSPNVTDCYRRSETVVPQQALAMVNSSLVLAESRRLAATLARESNATATPEGCSAFVGVAFERILCRAPSDAERSTCLEFLTEQARRLGDSANLAAFSSGDENVVKPAGDAAERARENLIHVLFNHNDFVTVR